MASIASLLKNMAFHTVLWSSPAFVFAEADAIDAYCKEAGKITVNLLKKEDRQAYLSAEKERGIYQFFQVAERVSLNRAYGKDKNKRVLQLICLEEFAAPAEIEDAAGDAYQHWKSGADFTFDLCRYSTSGVGAGFCAKRWAGQQDKEREKELVRITGSLNTSQQALVMEAYYQAADFFQTKALKEEFHGGTGYIAWRLESASEQKDRYFGRIASVLKGVFPESFPDLKKANQLLNEVYQQVRGRLIMMPITGFNMRVELADVREVQKRWLDYRDKTAVMLAELNHKVSLQQWQALLTQERTEELRLIVEYDESAP